MIRPLRAATFRRRGIALLLALSTSLWFAPTASWACACGCGIFDVGAGTMLPTDSESGLSAWFRYAYMDQNQNWEGSSKAPASDNFDKEINTSFYTVGGQYMIDRNWTVMTELPVFARALTTTDDGTVFGPAGSIYTGHINDLGDLQVTGMYTGFSPDLSTGLTFGVKLPTGNYTGPIGPLGGAEFDRDSLPGTGSTDLMFGGYHIGGLNSDNSLAYFVQARYQFAVFTRDSYRPGNELDSAVGLTYDFGAIGRLTKVAPVLQILGSYREHDTEANADPLNSGYKRLLIAPGIEMRLDKVRLYADVELPIYQFTNAASSTLIEGTAGQLVAPALFKVQLAYDF
ncbi:MAG: hypothetical protein WAN51_03065 [Alphaproteobacteria bacterium]